MDIWRGQGKRGTIWHATGFKASGVGEDGGLAVSRAGRQGQQWLTSSIVGGGGNALGIERCRRCRRCSRTRSGGSLVLSRKRQPSYTVPAPLWPQGIGELAQIITGHGQPKPGGRGQRTGLRQRVVVLLDFEAEDHRGRGVTTDARTEPSPPHLQM